MGIGDFLFCQELLMYRAPAEAWMAWRLAHGRGTVFAVCGLFLLLFRRKTAG
jgi:hypothetical protein